jgi:thymidylate synthase (FAD)
MNLIDQSWTWVAYPTSAIWEIESAGRTCYKSEDSATEDSAERFCRKIIKSGHHSVIEHASASVRIVTNRGVTHELVRHRLAAYSQESTRYVKYDGDMEFIKPVWFGSIDADFLADYAFIKACVDAERYYKRLLVEGWRPEQAREVLPNALKTEIVMTANLREWRHVFQLRCSAKAHPQMRALMRGMLLEFKRCIPVVFDDIYPLQEEGKTYESTATTN